MWRVPRLHPCMQQLCMTFDCMGNEEKILPTLKVMSKGGEKMETMHTLALRFLLQVYLNVSIGQQLHWQPYHE